MREIEPEEFILNAEEGRDKRDWVLPKIKTDAVRTDFFSRRNITPPVLNQGRIGSCVGQAGRVVFGDTPGCKGIDLSPMCIYKTGQLYDRWDGEDYSGTSISGACKALLKEGVCSELEWPYGFNTPAAVISRTKRIYSYYTVKLDRDEELLQLLLDESLWFAMKVRTNFYRVDSSGIIDEKEYLKSKYKGGHSMTIIGYIYIEGVLYWEVQNSWGDGWGQDGYCYIPHTLLLKIVKGPIYVLITNEERATELSELRFAEKERLRNLPWYKRLIEWLKDLF